MEEKQTEKLNIAELNIAEKLMYIQSALDCPKSHYNKFGSYYYRNAEDILNAVKPLCKRAGCVVIVSDRIIHGGDRYYVKATATIIDCKTGDKISVNGYARDEEKRSADNKSVLSPAQVTGASSSYARKYALNGLFSIDDVKDDDYDK